MIAKRERCEASTPEGQLENACLASGAWNVSSASLYKVMEEADMQALEDYLAATQRCNDGGLAWFSEFTDVEFVVCLSP